MGSLVVDGLEWPDLSGRHLQWADVDVCGRRVRLQIAHRRWPPVRTTYG